jgi:hypothetical protein
MNHLKTYILLAAMTALFGGVGYFVGGTGGMLIALAVAGGDEPVRVLERGQNGAAPLPRPGNRSQSPRSARARLCCRIR